ncbi:MAG: thioredoxin family protein [Dehalococcoidia bacterium]
MTAVETLTSDQLEPKVLRAPEPVVLDFYQASCAPCRVLEPRLERIAQQYAGRVPVYRVDIDQDLTAAERFNVKSLPTVLVLRAGTEVERLDGLITDAALKAAFDRVARG